MGRIIPARAGFTSNAHSMQYQMEDHPRTRGVYNPVSTLRNPTYGSSPHARGLLLLFAASFWIAGIIPARAGFTNFTIPSSTTGKDHPRTRGVYTSPADKYVSENGSSPHARGLQVLSRERRELSGIIPARAGFTKLEIPVTKSRPDHPRTRGVYVQVLFTLVCVRGSSPHARGLPLVADIGGVGGGIIPARAGFTRMHSRVGHGLWDHPRTRGVYSTGRLALRRLIGSSPHARGLLHNLAFDGSFIGIIPARAGFTANGVPQMGL